MESNYVSLEPLSTILFYFSTFEIKEISRRNVNESLSPEPLSTIFSFQFFATNKRLVRKPESRKKYIYTYLYLSVPLPIILTRDTPPLSRGLNETRYTLYETVHDLDRHRGGYR